MLSWGGVPEICVQNTANIYGVNPSLGALVGILCRAKMFQFTTIPAFIPIFLADKVWRSKVSLIWLRDGMIMHDIVFSKHYVLQYEDKCY